ncbi:sugar ABC transporter substrate-binding protein [Geosporobacter ferrireducens]|uniref:D-xylose transporter subunit XylF n=1 Tax=Geosporobacter ferrireducens TaxID=1424294 RepID=A0A1D8GIJ1_9FIRM|nr:substrate-binding domain-containing protein [Geosporobacter ferrireducens]AOT70753.1 D-xylose transporter subunit XylF [Geosporobacter ferrireducens]
MKPKEVLKLGILIILLIIFVSLIYLLGRNIYANYVNRNQTGTTVQGSDKIKIGFSLGTLKEERWIKDRDIIMAKVKELGAEIIVQNANNDDQDQLKQVKYLLEQNIDVLIIVPNDLIKAASAVELAKRQGVKVISYDRLVLNSNVDIYISFDSTEVGALMAQYIVDQVQNGNILIINGATSDHNTQMIKYGYDQVLQLQGEEQNIKVIEEYWSPNWMKEYAFKVTDELLQNKSKIDGIIAGNDGLADGVIEALSEHRMAGKTIVVGQDADLAACQRIVEGTQLMTVYKPIEKLADAAAKTAIQLAKGESLNNIQTTMYDGKYSVPYYVLEPIAVDKSNIEDTIIKDGFHMRDEVYRNSPENEHIN